MILSGSHESKDFQAPGIGVSLRELIDLIYSGSSGSHYSCVHFKPVIVDWDLSLTTWYILLLFREVLYCTKILQNLCSL